MNMMISTADIEREVTTPFSTMTRRDKLLRLAHLVRVSKRAIALLHALEHRNDEWMRMVNVTHPGVSQTPFGLAVADPVFAEEGLKKDASLLDVRNFFELSQAELHEFSCDCGGAISNAEMAERIARLAGPAPVSESKPASEPQPMPRSRAFYGMGW